MGVTFHWFKNFEIEKHEHMMGWVGTYHNNRINFIGDCGSTSHSYGNKRKLINIFEKIGITIPDIPDEIFEEEPEKYILSLLIDPSVMSQKCKELLDSDLDLSGMSDRISRIKELSDKGYYIAYDMF